MNINYQKWDNSNIIIELDGKKYVVAPEDLVLPYDATSSKGFFNQDLAKKVNAELASGWMIPTRKQMLEMVKTKTCNLQEDGMYWIDNADRMYNLVLECDIEIEGWLLYCRIRCICELCLAME